MARILPFLTTQALRPFVRLWPQMLWRRPAPDGRRVLYLTFDDGPTAGMTKELIEVLDDNDARATCFLIGAHVERHPDLTRHLIEQGHTIGNHTFTHPDAWRYPTAHLREELYRATEMLEQYAGAPIRHMRPPYGHFTTTMRTWCRANGQKMVMWDVMPGDYLSTATPAKLERHLRRTIRPGSVVVLHDNPRVEQVTLPMLRMVLPSLRREGWVFEAL